MLAARIVLAQRLDRFIDVFRVCDALFAGQISDAGNLALHAAAAFLGPAASGMFDQDSPHGLGGGGVEMGPAFP